MSIPQTPDNPAHPLAGAIRFLEDEIAPRAAEIDGDPAALGEALRAMASSGLLGMRAPREYGGLGLGEVDFRRFQEACARASGCLAFLQTQHQSASAMLARSDNEELKTEYLPPMAFGKRLCGIAFSQLRRKSEVPVLSALPADKGYTLTGSAPWLTGVGFFDSCVTAATLPNGESIFVLHDLVESPALRLSIPMKLASMEAAQTVGATFEDYFVSEKNVLFVRPGDWIENNDMINIALQSPFALGCAQAGLDIVADNYARKGIKAIDVAHSKLAEELAQCRTEAYAAMDDRENYGRSLKARAWAIDVAFRSAVAAIVSSSGAGNSMKHPAQRVYREALVFAVSAQTGDIMEATLDRIQSSRSEKGI